MSSTLDVSSLQVLARYEDDTDGLEWHHRLLLVRIADGKWVALTPDFELLVIDLDEREHAVLRRRSPFPEWAGGILYAFDPGAVTQRSLAEHISDAKIQAAVLAEGVLDEDPDGGLGQWMVCMPSHPRFGQVLDEAQVASPDFVSLDNEGLYRFPDGVCRVGRFEGESTVAKAAFTKSGGDVRLLGSFYDENGRRVLDFGRAVGMLGQPEVPDWTFQGPRLCRELLRNVVDGPGNLVSYHAEWVRLSGIFENSSFSYEHRHCCECLRLALVHDQVDASALQVCEQIARRLDQIEMAVERCPSKPDFSGLDVLTDGAITARGSARNPTFRAWVGDRQRERANILKQRRLYAEEQRGAAKGDGKGGKKGRKGQRGQEEEAA